jgi:excisionase family DNA binding protein
MESSMSKLLTVSDVSERLGITPHGVRALIRKGNLKAERLGRDYVIRESDLKTMKRPGMGRPKRDG